MVDYQGGDWKSATIALRSTEIDLATEAEVPGIDPSAFQ
jgi:hypothetical protein